MRYEPATERAQAAREIARQRPGEPLRTPAEMEIARKRARADARRRRDFKNLLPRGALPVPPEIRALIEAIERHDGAA